MLHVRSTMQVMHAYLMILDMLWQTSVTVYITEVELATFCKHSVCLLQNPLFVRAQIDNTVADDEIKGLISNASLVKILYVSFNEAHICHAIGQLLAVGISMPL